MKLVRWILGRIILTLDAIFRPKAPMRSVEEQKKIDDATTGFSLYQFEACPFCVKVRRFLVGAGVNITLKDATKEPYRTELREGGGKLQVPCLRIEKTGGSTEWMFESSDIIAHLRSTLPL